MSKEFYRKNRNNIRTSLGGMVEPPDGMVVCGRSIFQDLIKEPLPYSGLLNHIFIKNTQNESITKILDLIAVLSCYPDPRIWCHRAGRLAASLNATPGECLASSVSIYESIMFGGGATIKCMEFIRDGVKECANNGFSVEEYIDFKLKNKEIIKGFGRPVMKKDERVSVIVDAIKKVKCKKNHFNFVLECEKILIEKKDIYMNFAAPYSAFFLDLGLTPKTGSLLITLLVMPSLAAVISEELDRPPEDFLPMSINDIEFVKKNKKNVDN